MWIQVSSIQRFYNKFNHDIKVRLKNNLSNIKESYVRSEVSHIIPLNTKRNVSREQSIMEFMKNIENNIRKLLSSVHYNVRNHLLAIINNLLSFKSKNNSIRHRLTKLVQCTKQFLKKNRNIIFTKAAKAT